MTAVLLSSICLGKACPLLLFAFSSVPRKILPEAMACMNTHDNTIHHRLSLNRKTCLVGCVALCTIDSQDTAAAAIFLASKVEEFRVHIKDVMMVTYRVRHKNERPLVENSDVSIDTSTLFCRYSYVREVTHPFTCMWKILMVF